MKLTSMPPSDTLGLRPTAAATTLDVSNTNHQPCDESSPGTHSQHLIDIDTSTDSDDHLADPLPSLAQELSGYKSVKMDDGPAHQKRGANTGAWPLISLADDELKPNLNNKHTASQSSKGQTVESAAEASASKSAGIQNATKQNATRGMPPAKENSSELEESCFASSLAAILAYMDVIDNLMSDFSDYITVQNKEEKPLYQWSKYTKYENLARGTEELHWATDRLETLSLSEVTLTAEDASIYFTRALNRSVSVSNHATFAMGVMNRRTAMCIQEVEESPMNYIAKEGAKIIITVELEKMLRHLTAATNRVYTTINLLQRILYADHYGANDATRCGMPWKRWLLIFVVILVSGAIGAALGRHIVPESVDFHITQAPCEDKNIVNTEVRNVVTRIAEVIKHRNEIIAVKMRGLEEQCKRIEASHTNQALRIDNLWDALGPPNEDGTFFSSMSDGSYRLPSDISRRIHEVESQAARRIHELEEKMREMRKQWLRADIRLTKRLDKVERKG